LGARQTQCKKVDQVPAAKAQSHHALKKSGRLKIDHVFTAVKKNQTSFDCVIHTTHGSLGELVGRNGPLNKADHGLAGASLPHSLRKTKILVRFKL